MYRLGQKSKNMILCHNGHEIISLKNTLAANDEKIANQIVQLLNDSHIRLCKHCATSVKISPIDPVGEYSELTYKGHVIQNGVKIPIKVITDFETEKYSISLPIDEFLTKETIDEIHRKMKELGFKK